MTQPTPTTALQLRSLVRSSGELEVSLHEVPVPEPGADEVLVRIEATPINPSDLGLLFGAADLGAIKVSGTAARPVLTAPIPERSMKAMAGRADQSLPVGNEGAGTVVKAGSSPAAQALLGKTVAIIGGAMYAQYRCIAARDCLLLPADATAADGAKRPCRSRCGVYRSLPGTHQQIAASKSGASFLCAMHLVGTARGLIRRAAGLRRQSRAAR